MDNVMKEIASSGIVPVVVLDDAKDAVNTAKALYEGGIRVMEITFRTAAAEQSIRNVANGFPEMTVGAGTVITLHQCKAAVEAGAKFIVSPGYDEEVVSWCLENGIPVTPGCVTPTEITCAVKHGLNVVKFFPANVYGGLKAMKSLSGPFVGMQFIPTGGINEENCGEYASAPYVYAVGGSWICPKKDIAEGNFGHITELCRKARNAFLGYEVAHVGINAESEELSDSVCSLLEKAFGFETRRGNSSNFASSEIEVMKSKYLGNNGHIAVRTNRLECAVEDLARKGFEADLSTKKEKNGHPTAVYLKDEVGGFAVHLLQK